MPTPQTPTQAVPKEPEIQVQSAKPIGQLTAAERQKRFDELRKRMGKSRLEVKGKPGLHYFWAHKTDDAEIIRLEGQFDYIIVREPNAKEVLAGKAKPEIEASGLREDGTYQVGDVILMQCPQDNYDFMLLANDEKMEQMKSAVKEDFRTGAETQGVPTFEFDKPRK